MIGSPGLEFVSRLRDGSIGEGMDAVGTMLFVAALVVAVIAAVYAVTLRRRNRSLDREVRFVRLDRARVLYEVESDRAQDSISRLAYYAKVTIALPTSHEDEDTYRALHKHLRSLKEGAREALRLVTTDDAKINLRSAIREAEVMTNALDRYRTAQRNLARALTLYGGES